MIIFNVLSLLDGVYGSKLINGNKALAFGNATYLIKIGTYFHFIKLREYACDFF